MDTQKDKREKLSLFNAISVFTCIIALLIMTFAACTTENGSEQEAATNDEESPVDSETMANEVEIAVEQQSKYGQYLVDDNGRTLYLFTPDSAGQSNCYDKCAEMWPPVLAENPAIADTALNSSMLGTIKRDDGAMQATYNGWPLYYFVKDEGASEIKGQDIHSFGGEWYIISPQGTLVEAESE